MSIDNLKEQSDVLLSKIHLPRNKFQLGYFAKFSKFGNREEYRLHKWLK